MNEYEKHVWYCVRNGNRLGPMPWETLRQRVRSGQLRPDDLVWSAPFKDSWRPAGSVTGLFPETSEATPPPPPPPVEEPLLKATDSAYANTANRPLGEASGPSCRGAFRQVWQSMLQVLFLPFDISRWFSIGFCAWLAQVGGNGSNLQQVVDVSTLRQQMAADNLNATVLVGTIYENMAAVPIFTFGMLFSTAVGLLMAVIFCWLRSHGSLMFLYRIRRPHATIREAWRSVGETTKSLFWWRVGFGALGVVGLLVMGFGAALSLGLGLLRSGDRVVIQSAITLPWITFWGGGLLFLAMLWVAIKSLSFHFMEPYLFRDREGIRAAWLRVWEFCRDYPLTMVRFYVLLSIYLFLAMMAVFGFVVFSCCLGAALLIIPVIGSVVMLPLLWVHRGVGMTLIDFKE